VDVCLVRLIGDPPGASSHDGGHEPLDQATIQSVFLIFIVEEILFLFIIIEDFLFFFVIVVPEVVFVIFIIVFEVIGVGVAGFLLALLFVIIGIFVIIVKVQIVLIVADAQIPVLLLVTAEYGQGDVDVVASGDLIEQGESGVLTDGIVKEFVGGRDAVHRAGADLFR